MSVVSSNINSLLRILLSELSEECLSTIKLINQLDIEDLTDEQIEDILGELIASVTHLQVQASIVKKELEKEE
jgi:hypothetical protein